MVKRTWHKNSILFLLFPFFVSFFLSFLFHSTKGQSALDLDSIHIDFTPQSLCTKLDWNWINPSWSYPHFKLNLWWLLHKAWSWSCACYSLSHSLVSGYPAGTRHLQTDVSVNKYDCCQVITPLLVTIHFWSRSYPPTRGGLARSQSDRDWVNINSASWKRAQVWTGLN